MANRLCDRCSYVLKSDALWRPSSLGCNGTVKYDVFFHSRNVKQLLESAAAGCHLCAQVRKESNDLERSSPDIQNDSARVMMECYWEEPTVGNTSPSTPIAVIKFWWYISSTLDSMWIPVSILDKDNPKRDRAEYITHGWLRGIIAKFKVEEIKGPYVF